MHTYWEVKAETNKNKFLLLIKSLKIKHMIATIDNTPSIQCPSVLQYTSVTVELKLADDVFRQTPYIDETNLQHSLMFQDMIKI